MDLDLEYLYKRGQNPIKKINFMHPGCKTTVLPDISSRNCQSQMKNNDSGDLSNLVVKSLIALMHNKMHISSPMYLYRYYGGLLEDRVMLS